MKAMILAAGFGTRLRPLTLKKSKALVPVGNRPLIDRTIDYLKAYGVREIVVNAHHHSEQLEDHLYGGRHPGIDVEVRREPEILGTGGGIRNTEGFWGSAPFLVVNGDILTDIDLAKAYEAHCRKRALATLVLHDQKAFNKIQIDAACNITEIPFDTQPAGWAFTGIHVMDPEMLSHIPQGVHSDIMDAYRRLIAKGLPVKAYVSVGHLWRDVGTVESYFLANQEALKGNAVLLARGCDIHPWSKVRDWAIIGERSVLEEGVEIGRSILWEDVVVRRGRKVMDSIVTSNVEVQRDLAGEIL